MNVDEEWMDFLVSHDTGASVRIMTSISPVSKSAICNDVVKCAVPAPILEIESNNAYNLNISTKTKILFLNRNIDIGDVFWKIPIIEYWRPDEGIVKKQMKIVSKTQEELDIYHEHLKSIEYYTESIIKQINNPSARSIKFKDERKITVGISKKDIMNYRGKAKNAFYNCFAVIVRIKYDGVFREIHVKVFNTGKMEIPGIVHADLLDTIKTMILAMVRPIIDGDVGFTENMLDSNVLINSNFNCGYFINRDILHSILRSEQYDIEAVYDPCSYPGVKCKFYFNHKLGFIPDAQTGIIQREDRNMKMSELDETDKYTEVSFMIFRTGSCLIVGNCTERVLLFVFEYIKKILISERRNIYIPSDNVIAKNKNTKPRKKIIKVSKIYMESVLKVNTDI
jgi:hypothetical protein